MNKNYEKLNNVILILWILIIWGHSILPGTVSSEESGILFSFLQMLLPFITHQMVRKAAHFTEYAILGFLNIRKNILSSMFLCLIVALIDESIQLLAEGRAGLITDVWIDFAGAIVGIVIRSYLIRLNEAKTK